MKKDDRERCSWATTELYKEYHDEEWGKPVHDDRKLFEMLVLEGMQAGLSWLTILNKRAAFKEAFNEFDFIKINRHSPYLSITLHKCYPYYLFGISTFPSSVYHSIALRKFSITIV